MKKTLLLADDSPTIQKVINLTFADEGIDVIAVGDGNAALQSLREVTPDLVMADVHMPGLNGYQICERIRQNAELSKVPVILLVGSFEPFDEEEAKRVGADDFLMKPFQSIRQLVGRVAALLDSTTAEPQTMDITAAPESPAMHISDTPSITPEDIFRTPWTETPEATVSNAVESTESLGSEQPEVPAAPAPVELTEEADDLSDFDTEFDKKFPDAAALSSESSFGQFVPPPREEPPGQTFEDPQAEEAVPETALFEKEAARFAEEAHFEEQTHFAEQTPDLAPVETPEAEEAAAVEAAVEAAEEAETEAASILSLDEMDSPESPESAVENDFLLEIEPAEGIEEQTVDTSLYGANTLRDISVDVGEPPPVMEDESPPVMETEQLPVMEAALPPLEVEEVEESVLPEPQYNFRETDAFDDDSTIEESFHGLPPVIEAAAVEDTALENAAALPAEMESVTDSGPGEVSEDQADGFSVAEPPEAPAQPQLQPQQQITPEAIEAIAQRVLDKLTEKLVRDMAPEMRNIIMNEISGDDKPKE